MFLKPEHTQIAMPDPMHDVFIVRHNECNNSILQRISPTHDREANRSWESADATFFLSLVGVLDRYIRKNYRQLIYRHTLDYRQHQESLRNKAVWMNWTWSWSSMMDFLLRTRTSECVPQTPLALSRCCFPLVKKDINKQNPIKLSKCSQGASEQNSTQESQPD